MCNPVYFECHTGTHFECGNPRKKYVQQQGSSNQVRMVLGAVKECSPGMYDKDTKTCRATNPPTALENMLSIGLWDRARMTCAYDIGQELTGIKGQPVSEDEKREIHDQQTTDALRHEEIMMSNSTEGLKEQRALEKKVRADRNQAAFNQRRAEQQERMEKGRRKKMKDDIDALPKASMVDRLLDEDPLRARSGGRGVFIGPQPKPSPRKHDRSSGNGSGSLVPSASRPGSQVSSNRIGSDYAGSDAAVSQGPKKKGKASAAPPAKKKKKQQGSQPEQGDE